MNRSAGHELILLLFIAILSWHAGRAAFLQGKPPALVVDDTPGIYVWLGKGFGIEGVRQFSDETRLEGVIKLTNVGAPIRLQRGISPQEPVLSGQSYHIEGTEDDAKVVRDGLMSAAKRMALGISLHPDRMNYDDWLELKGIGPVIAERIEIYRQKNGDFGRLDRLQGVKGIGPKRIEAWRRFF